MESNVGFPVARKWRELVGLLLLDYWTLSSGSDEHFHNFVRCT